MARALTNEREQVLVDAHVRGVTRAHEVFKIACDSAKNTYPDDYEAHFAYIAGLVQELRRIAARAQNKGFRK
jgi:hypothetical protein